MRTTAATAALLWMIAALVPLDRATAATDCAAGSSAAACLCSGKAPEDATFLSELRDQAIAVRRALCIDAAPEEETYQALFDFALVNNGRWFAPFGGFKGGSDPLQEVVDAMASSSADAPFTVPNASLSLDDTILVGDTPFEAASPELCPDPGCGAVFDEFLDYYNYAHTTLAAKGALAFASSVVGLSAQWTRFLERSRSQTPLELLVNGAVHDRENQRLFAAPPEKQWIVMHPSLVIENVSDAIDGEETVPALMIELVGANWWRQSAWYRPSGASIIAAYSDRPGIDDVGYGVALHFRSLYSIAYTDRDGAGGVLISFDLLKLLQNERAVLEQLLR